MACLTAKPSVSIMLLLSGYVSLLPLDSGICQDGENRVSIPESKSVEKTLERPDIHRQWKNSYRTEENEKFYEYAFDYIVSCLSPRKDSIFLDAGCGTCNHSIRLARRGFSVVAADFSESALKMAELNLQSFNMQDKIKLKRENLLSLSFADETFDYILCWGVLMHIPDIEKAISELSRVLKKGGVLIISEGNMSSLQSIVLRNLKALLGKEKSVVRRTGAGLEYWTTTSAGDLLTRQTNMPWLKKRFQNTGFVVKKHVSGQFTELYTRVSSKLLVGLIHGFNNLWFKYIKIPVFSFGNILILQKKA